MEKELNKLKTQSPQSGNEDKKSNDLQQMYDDLIEKQTHMEKRFEEEKVAQEKAMKEKMTEIQTKMILTKSKFKSRKHLYRPTLWFFCR